MPVEARDWRQASKENVAAHYDLSNDMFAAFLDPTMTYSAGLFENAPRKRFSRPAVRSSTPRSTAPGQHRRRCGYRLLEIGTG